jgi:hypothetical protein
MDILKTLRLLCKPALIYLIFSTTQILFDIYGKFFELAIIKLVVSILITFVLDSLCKSGLSSVSWVFIFVPFMLMTIVISILLLAVSVNYKDVSSQNNQNTTPYDKLKDVYDDTRIEYAYVFDGQRTKNACKYSDLNEVKKQCKEAKKHNPKKHKHKHNQKHKQKQKQTQTQTDDSDYVGDDNSNHEKILVD